MEYIQQSSQDSLYILAFFFLKKSAIIPSPTAPLMPIDVY